MSISYLKLKKIAYFCLLLPSVIFVLGFLKWYIGIPVAILCGAAYFFVWRDTKSEGAEYGEKVLEIKPLQLLILVGVVTLWCYLSGLGNLYYQSEDWAARNAIFRDLIGFDWPVIYPLKDAALVYYIGYWLPAALFGKLVYHIGGDLGAAFGAGNIALWIWSVVCVTVVILLVLVFLNANSTKRIWAAVIIFIGFSGLDMIGIQVSSFMKGAPVPNHIEWWTPFQFSSMTTCLGWVFNQAVFSWLATVCFISEKKVRNYAFILVCALTSAPLPCVGLAVYMAGVALLKLWQAFREDRLREFAWDVFTLQNVILAATMLPIYFLYYKTNVAINVGQLDQPVYADRDWAATVILLVLAVGAAALGIVLRAKKKRAVEAFFFCALAVSLLVWSIFQLKIGMAYLWFILLEGGVYLFLVWRDERREPLFYLTWIVMAMCPLITAGTSVDFCMRASISAVFILMMLCIRYLFNHAPELLTRKLNVNTVTVALLIIALVLGAVTAYKEFERGVRAVAEAGYLAVVNDWIYTLNRSFEGSLVGTDRNFIANKYYDTFFFRYFAK